MAWRCVSKIKNQLNEFEFATFPLGTYAGPSGNSNTTIEYFNYRESYQQSGSAAFNTAVALLDNLNAQTSIPRLTPPTSYVKMVFGDIGGSAVDLRYILNGSAPSYGVDIAPYVYRNMQSRRMLTASSSWSTDLLYDKKIFTWALVYNDETDEMYLAEINGWLKWYSAVGTYHYYDRVVLSIVIIDGRGADNNLYSIFSNSIPSGGDGNPYEGGGLNDEPAGGEDQNYEETSDTIAEPTLPSNPATGSGFITAYVPTLSEINDVADYLIDPNVLQALAGTVLKLSDVVIGLSIFPFTIAATGSKEIKMNLCGAHLTTGVTCHYSDSQFVTLNMGTLEVKKYWDNCLDYDPYTRITLYLPYVGFVDLDTDEVMGKNVTVKYNVDIVTGCCLALIIVDDSVLYQYPGECSCQVPITSVSFDTFLQSAVQLGITAASGARAVKGAGASLAEAGGHVLATDDAGVQRLAMGDYDKERAKFTGIKASVTDSLISASVGAVLSAKGQYSHAGAMSSCAGILGTQKPFLIIKRPKQCMPEGYESIRGFPCNMKARLSDLEGYTEVGDIHLNIPNATVQEIVECEQFLKEGVYL